MRLGTLGVIGAIATAAASPSPEPTAIVGAPMPASSASSQPSVAPAIVLPSPPTPAPTPVYHFVYRTVTGTGAASPSPTLPQIAEIDVNEVGLSAPGPLHVRVLASPVVTTVVAQTLGRSIPIPRYAVGEFRLDGDIPSLPFFLRGRTFDIDFIAASANGATTSIDLPFQLR